MGLAPPEMASTSAAIRSVPRAVRTLTPESSLPEVATTSPPAITRMPRFFARSSWIAGGSGRTSTMATIWAPAAAASKAADQA